MRHEARITNAGMEHVQAHGSRDVAGNAFGQAGSLVSSFLVRGQGLGCGELGVASHCGPQWG